MWRRNPESKGGDAAWGIGTALIDIDNDGDLDIYVCNYDHPNQLFINRLIHEGKRGEALSFSEEAARFGINVIDACVEPSFCDFDRDGDLDLYLLMHQLYREGGRPVEGLKIFEENGKYVLEDKWRRYFWVEQEERREDGSFLYNEAPRADRFFRNDGEAGFTDITGPAGISTERHWGNSATWWDYNNDMWPDLYIGNDFFSPDFLYRNNGDGTFTEVAKETLRHSTWFSMGAVQSDFNNDGLTDFVLADMLPTTHYMQKASMGSMGARLDKLAKVDGPRQLMRNALYINTGTDRFMEGSWLAGVAKTEWTWAIRSADFDCDGLPDLYFTNGIPRQFNHSDLPEMNHESLVGRTQWEHYEHTEERREANAAFRNLGNFEFEKTTQEWGLDHIGMSYGASMGDLDRDGRIDLVVTNLQDPVSVYRNQNAADSNRIVIDFKGISSNSHGIGCQVAIETDSGRQVRHLYPSGGFLDADEAIAHFGLGPNTVVRTLKVDWPSGRSQLFRDLEANQRYTITEPDGPAEKSSPVKSRRPESPMFTESDVLDGFGNIEAAFNDFDRQLLLPFKLSQLGPAQAWGDIDGDGDSDLFFGGASGQPGQLFENKTEAGSAEVRLRPKPVPLFSADARYEDMGTVFIDVDSDGDLDLYVASGGIECDPGDKLLQDRLYLNNGEGEFSRAPEGSVPEFRESSSVVVAADVDRDGDVDLFVGSRSVPGHYPGIPRSIFLRNDGGRFTNATAEIGPQLEKTGLVTSALWSDVDADGWQDLLVTHDWGAVKLFRNREGKLEDDTENAGLSENLGWWNGIAGRDIDGDGDIDYVATNLGLNTQYHASVDSPELLFYGDFDGTGKYHIVEAEYAIEDGKKVCYPRRGLSCSSHAMPFVREKLTTYHDYASSTLFDIYDQSKLEKSQLHTANNLRSVLLRNDGEGVFQIEPLPHLAQIAPAFGVVLRDFDLDGITDCFLVNNHFTPQPETGAMDGGLSLLLRGTGNVENPFEPVWPGESGLEVPGDSKSLGAIDLNLDGRDDFVVGVNSGNPSVFLNSIENPNTQPLRIQLTGKPGNPFAIGSRVTVIAQGLASQTAEVHAGGGYLSQSDAGLNFAAPKGSEGEVKVTVTWPDGSESTAKSATGAAFLKIEQK